MKLTSWFFDFEVLKNCFTAIFVRVGKDNSKYIEDYINADIKHDSIGKAEALSKMQHKTFIAFDDINQIKMMIDFIKSSKCQTLIGYNNRRYDDIILDYIMQYLNLNNSVDIITAELYQLSQDIISSQKFGNYRKDNDIPISKVYYSIDLMKLHYLDKKKVSLTQVSIVLKWYRVEEYEPPPITDEEIKRFNYTSKNIAWYDRYVIDSHLPKLLEYNLNDVLVLWKLYYKKIDELKNRIITTKLYKVDVMSDSRSATADKLMSKFYSDATGLKWWEFVNGRTYRKKVRFEDIIKDTVKFETPELQSFLKHLQNIVITQEDSFKESLIFRGTEYTFGKGGLHSKDRGGVFKSNDKYRYIDYDFSSWYPNLILKYGIKPQHLLSVFLKVLEVIVTRRLEAKANGDKDTADILKIVINAVFGKYGLESWMLDLKAMYSVTVNGQLHLLMLAEQLELNDFHVISANTDGLITKVDLSRLEEYQKICTDFSDYLSIDGEFTEYDKYIRTAVNDYMTLKHDGKYKLKGEFVSDLEIDKGYKHPVVAKTLFEYYINDNTDIDKVLRSFDILDYCISIKVGDQFKTEYHTIIDGKRHIEVLQKSNRYYVSTKGGVILKRNKADNKLINIVKGKTVTIFNRLELKEDYNIDYNWYKSKVIDAMNRINNTLTKNMKKTIGNMFDNIE